MEVKVHSPSGLGADGMAFWYVNTNEKKEGKAFGGPENWNGLAVFLDSFDNDGKVDQIFFTICSLTFFKKKTKTDNPRISVFTNENKWTYNPHTDNLASSKVTQSILLSKPSELQLTTNNTEKMNSLICIDEIAFVGFGSAVKTFFLPNNNVEDYLIDFSDYIRVL